MPETLLQAVLELTDQLEGVVIPHHSIAHYSAGQLSQLISEGILQSTSNATEIPRPGRFGQGPDLVVRKTARGVEGVADEDDYFPPISLSEDEVRQYAVSIPALVEKIRSDNGIDGTGFRDDRGLFPVGQKALAGGGAIDVYLSLPNDGEDILLTRCRRLASGGNQRATVVLTPRSAAISTEGRKILESWGVLLVPLMNVTSQGRITLDLNALLSTGSTAVQIPGDAARGKARSGWLDRKLSQHPDWSSDTDIAGNLGPTYNTIQRYRSGTISSRDRYVRRKLATAFGCELDEVPK